MICLNGTQVALISAAFANVAHNTEHNFKSYKALEEISKEIGAIQVSVYDSGPREDKIRHLRFDFSHGSIELEVGPRPALIVAPPKPDFDPTTPGSPVAMAA